MTCHVGMQPESFYHVLWKVSSIITVRVPCVHDLLCSMHYDQTMSLVPSRHVVRFVVPLDTLCVCSYLAVIKLH